MPDTNIISAKEVARLMANDEAVIIDVREPAEYRGEHIEYARNLPLSEVSMDAANLPEHQHKKLILHCKSGKRSMLACEKLHADNIPYDLWNLDGGIEAWKKEGLSIVTSGKSVLPLDQQVQLAIGIMILAGLLLYASGQTYGLILPMISGLGLTNAGLTGWCGLAKLMGKMPWNH